MCGIVGFVANNLDGVHTAEALDSLKHRGADSGGFIAETCAGQSIYLGHRRLSIIDLSEAGNQPMNHGPHTLIYNGEVYNFRELRRHHFPSQPFKSETDSEVVLRLYAKYGTGFVKMLAGDFALALLDRHQNKLILARDRVGVKPLYIYQRAGILAFASEIKAFKAAGLYLSVNETGIGRFLIFKYSPGTETLYQEVQKFKPATVMEVDLHSGSTSTYTYWNLSEEITPFKGSYSDAKSQLQQLVETAVTDRLVGDVPIANFLSGGLDSSIIAKYLKDTNNVHYCAVKAHSDLLAEGTTSDGYYARKLARDWKLNLSEIKIGSNTLTEENIRKAVRACDDLIADGSIIPAMLISEAAAIEHRVVLSGMGADEIFLGYNGHFLLKISAVASRLPGVQPALGRALRLINAGKGPLKAYRRYLQKWGNNMGQSFEAGRYSIVGDVDSAREIYKGNDGFEEFMTPYFTEEKPPFDALFEFEMENFLVKNLQYLDGAGMAHGLESRVPFLDHSIIEFAASLPVAYKLDWKLKSKKILKEAYARDIPGYITKRRKAGFGMPLRSLLAKQEIIGRLLPLEYFGDQPYFNADKIKRLIEAHKSGRQDQSALIYALICLRIWREEA